MKRMLLLHGNSNSLYIIPAKITELAQLMHFFFVTPTHFNLNATVADEIN